MIRDVRVGGRVPASGTKKKVWEGSNLNLSPNGFMEGTTSGRKASRFEKQYYLEAYKVPFSTPYYASLVTDEPLLRQRTCERR